MRHILLLSFSVLVAQTGPVSAAPLPNKCGDHLENIASEKPIKPTMRSLGEEPPAAQIAAVDRQIDNCSVLVVINPQLARQPRWVEPSESPAAKKYHTFDD